MTICECYFEQAHSQTPMNTGLSIADADPIGVSFYIRIKCWYVCLFSLVHLTGSVVSLDCLEGLIIVWSLKMTLYTLGCMVQSLASFANTIEDPHASTHHCQM
jgi:hypothetical protein